MRGTFPGPIKGLDDVFGTAYGITWLVALNAAILTFLWGRIAINGAVRTMNLAPLNPDGTAAPELEAATDLVKLVAVLELVGSLDAFAPVECAPPLPRPHLVVLDATQSDHR